MSILYSRFEPVAVISILPSFKAGQLAGGLEVTAVILVTPTVTVTVVVLVQPAALVTVAV